MKRNVLRISCVLGAFSVLIGAVGTHLLQSYFLEIDRLGTFETAVKYQFYHVFLLLLIGFFYNKMKKPIIDYALYACLIGIFLFSGSLYILCFTNNPQWGVFTPFGGLLLILSWLLLVFSFPLKKK